MVLLLMKKRKWKKKENKEKKIMISSIIEIIILVNLRERKIFQMKIKFFKIWKNWIEKWKKKTLRKW